MKKTFLKLLAYVLSVATVLTAMPSGDLNKVLASSSNSKSNNIPTSAKVAAGVFGILAASALIGGICGALSSPPKESDETPSDTPANIPKRMPSTPGTNGDLNCVPFWPNANFRNSQNLCYFHALMQQLYSIKSFRDFVENYEIGSNPDIDKRMDAFKKIFDLMYQTNGEIPAETSAKLAKQILLSEPVGDFRFGNSCDIHEVWEGCLYDVRTVYDVYCNLGTFEYDNHKLAKSNIRASQVALNEHKLTLSDLLVEDSPDKNAFEDSFVGVWADPSNRKEVLSRLTADYFLKVDEKGDIVSQNGDERKFDLLAVGNWSDALVNEVYNNFSEDLCRKGLGDDFTDKRESPDAGERKKAFERILARLPIGRFIEDKSGQLIFNQDALIKAITKAKYEDLVSLVTSGQDKYKAPGVKGIFETLGKPELKDVEAKDDQFAIFVNRAKYGESGPRRNNKPIDFEDGKVKFKGEDFEVTAVTCYVPGHYYTYKKQAGQWYKYDDCYHLSGAVDWSEVSADAKIKCTMITFTKPGADTEKLSVSYKKSFSVGPMSYVRMNDVLSMMSINPVKLNNKMSGFEIVKTGPGTGYEGGIVDDELLEMYKNARAVAIVDASNTGGLGGHGVDGAIFKAMGDGVKTDLSRRLPVVEGDSTRIPEGASVIHGSYCIGSKHKNVPYVIQTVSPKLKNIDDLLLFYSAWYNAVKLGIESGCDILLMPAIGMGAFCENEEVFFVKKCACIAVQAILDAIRDCGGKRIKIVFIDHKDDRRKPVFFEELRRIIFET